MSAVKEQDIARLELENMKLDVEKEEKHEDCAERALKRELLQDEMQSFRTTMEIMMQDKSRQVHAVLSLLGVLLRQV